MSILGEQIKELREAARQFEGYQNGEISRMMREAAYTIESLRDRLQAATLGSEREKELEELVKQLWYLVNHRSGYGYAAALESIEEIGIEVDE